MRRQVIPLLLCSMLLCLPCVAQERILTVKESGGEFVPFACFVCEANERVVLSDNQGTMVLRQGDFAAGDILVLQSLFYEPFSIGVKELETMTEIVLTPKITELGSVNVYPEKYAGDMAKKMANYFSRNVADDYAAKVTWLSAIECNGKYREFMGYQGLMASCNFTLSSPPLYWEDKNIRYWFPLTVMKSDALAADNDEVLATDRVLPSGYYGMDNLKIRYLNAEDDPWIGKRALELYSPLNPRQVRNFTYRISDSYITEDGEVIVLHFKNKPGTFPHRTRITGQGYIHCMKESGRPIKMVTENLEDHYTNYPRTTTAAYPSVTQHRVEIDYGVCEGKIYTSGITMSIDWIDPGIESGRYYSYSQQRRRDPIANRLREYRYQTFTAPVLLDKDKVATVRANAWSQQQYHFVLTAPFERLRWENTVMPGIDREKLFRDLGVNGRPLYEQAEKNGIAIPWPGAIDPASIEQIVARYGSEEQYFEAIGNRTTQYNNIGRNTIHPLLYGEKYE